MTLTPQWLDELRARTVLSTLIGRTVKVTKAGQVCVEATMTHVHLDPGTLEPATLPPPFLEAAHHQR